MFNCGESVGAESIAFEGSVIGRLKYVNKMLQINALGYTQKAGHQIPENFIMPTGPKDTLTETVTPISNPLGFCSDLFSTARRT